MPNVVPFLSYAFIATFTPGPNNIMAMTYAGRHGFLKSVRFNLGVCTGFFIIMSLCNFFSAALYDAMPFIKPYILAAGAAYILWLAWKTFMDKPAQAQDKHGPGPDAPRFLTGLVLQFVNPKGILYGITVVSSFIAPYYQSPAALSGFALLLASLCLISTSCWALFGAFFNLFLSRHQRLVQVVMSLLLVYCAVALFL